MSRVRTGILLQQNVTGKESLLWDKWDGDFTTWGRNLPPEVGEQRCLSSASQAANVGDQPPVKPVLCWLRQIHLLTWTMKWQKGLRNVSVPALPHCKQYYCRDLTPFLWVLLWVGPLHTPAMQDVVSIKRNSFLFSVKAGKEERNEACFGEIAKGVGFCWKYWHRCPSLIWKLSSDADRSTCVWSGHVLSLWYKEKALGQQFKDLLDHFGYVGVALNFNGHYKSV